MNGRTLRDECGQFTFQTANGQSVIDYFIASDKCMAAAQSLHVLEEASRYSSDHNPLIMRIASETLRDAPTSTPSAASDLKVRYDACKAEAYQVALAFELQQHFLPFIQHELNVDLLSDKLVACLKPAAHDTMPQACKRAGVHSCKQQPWF